MTTREKTNDLRKRWNCLVPLVDRLLAGEIVKSPFGLTDADLEDFRGIEFGKNIRPVNLHFNNFDFSYLSGKRMIFANSILENCQFDNSQFALGDFESVFRNVSFVKAKLQGSGIASPETSFIECNFSRTDLTGMTGHGGRFQECLFETTKFKNAIMGASSFERCKFIGKIESVIFGNKPGAKMISCDLKNATFVDCTFYDMHFDSCQASDETLIIREWPTVLSKFKVLSSQHSDSDVRSVCNRWVGVWEQTLEHTPENIIDLTDLTKSEGPVVGCEMFHLFQQIVRERH